MATALASADVVALTDRLGAIWKRNLDVAAATAATDVSGTGMTDLISDVNGLGLAKNYLYGKPALDLQAAALAAKGLLAASDFAAFLRALNGDLGGLGAYASGQGATFKYYEYFRDLCALAGVTVLPAVVFKATNQTLATFAVTGATAGTFTGTGILDDTLYGPLACELLLTHDATSATAVTLTMQKADGTTESKVVNLTTSDHSGDVKAIGSASDLYKDCTACAVTGATSGDGWTIRTKILRTPSI